MPKPMPELELEPELEPKPIKPKVKAAPKWKYAKPRNNHTANFMYFEEGKPKKLLISNWEFVQGASDNSFKCYVEQEDNVPVDKVWYVWDFEFAQLLKKKLKKYVVGKQEITVVMKKDDEDTMNFDLVEERKVPEAKKQNKTQTKK